MVAILGDRSQVLTKLFATLHSDNGSLQTRKQVSRKFCYLLNEIHIYCTVATFHNLSIFPSLVTYALVQAAQEIARYVERRIRYLPSKALPKFLRQVTQRVYSLVLATSIVISFIFA